MAPFDPSIFERIARGEVPISYQHVEAARDVVLGMMGAMGRTSRIPSRNRYLVQDFIRNNAPRTPYVMPEKLDIPSMPGVATGDFVSGQMKTGRTETIDEFVNRLIAGRTSGSSDSFLTREASIGLDDFERLGLHLRARSGDVGSLPQSTVNKLYRWIDKQFPEFIEEMGGYTAGFDVRGRPLTVKAGLERSVFEEVLLRRQEENSAALAKIDNEINRLRSVRGSISRETDEGWTRFNHVNAQLKDLENERSKYVRGYYRDQNRLDRLMGRTDLSHDPWNREISTVVSRDPAVSQVGLTIEDQKWLSGDLNRLPGLEASISERRSILNRIIEEEPYGSERAAAARKELARIWYGETAIEDAAAVGKARVRRTESVLERIEALGARPVLGPDGTWTAGSVVRLPSAGAEYRGHEMVITGMVNPAAFREIDPAQIGKVPSEVGLIMRPAPVVQVPAGMADPDGSVLNTLMRNIRVTRKVGATGEPVVPLSALTGPAQPDIILEQAKADRDAAMYGRDIISPDRGANLERAIQRVDQQYSELIARRVASGGLEERHITAAAEEMPEALRRIYGGIAGDELTPARVAEEIIAGLMYTPKKKVIRDYWEFVHEEGKGRGRWQLREEFGNTSYREAYKAAYKNRDPFSASVKELLQNAIPDEAKLGGPATGFLTPLQQRMGRVLPSAQARSGEIQAEVARIARESKATREAGIHSKSPKTRLNDDGELELVETANLDDSGNLGLPEDAIDRMSARQQALAERARARVMEIVDLHIRRSEIEGMLVAERKKKPIAAADKVAQNTRIVQLERNQATLDSLLRQAEVGLSKKGAVNKVARELWNDFRGEVNQQGWITKVIGTGQTIEERLEELRQMRGLYEMRLGQAREAFDLNASRFKARERFGGQISEIERMLAQIDERIPLLEQELGHYADPLEIVGRRLEMLQDQRLGRHFELLTSDDFLESNFGMSREVIYEQMGKIHGWDNAMSSSIRAHFAPTVDSMGSELFLGGSRDEIIRNLQSVIDEREILSLDLPLYSKNYDLLTGAGRPTERMIDVQMAEIRDLRRMGRETDDIAVTYRILSDDTAKTMAALHMARYEKAVRAKPGMADIGINTPRMRAAILKMAEDELAEGGLPEITLQMRPESAFIRKTPQTPQQAIETLNRLNEIRGHQAFDVDQYMGWESDTLKAEQLMSDAWGAATAHFRHSRKARIAEAKGIIDAEDLAGLVDFRGQEMTPEYIASIAEDIPTLLGQDIITMRAVEPTSDLDVAIAARNVNLPPRAVGNLTRNTVTADRHALNEALARQSVLRARGEGIGKLRYHQTHALLFNDPLHAPVVGGKRRTDWYSSITDHLDEALREQGYTYEDVQRLSEAFGKVRGNVNAIDLSLDRSGLTADAVRRARGIAGLSDDVDYPQRYLHAPFAGGAIIDNDGLRLHQAVTRAVRLENLSDPEIRQIAGMLNVPMNLSRAEMLDALAAQGMNTPKGVAQTIATRIGHQIRAMSDPIFFRDVLGRTEYQPIAEEMLRIMGQGTGAGERMAETLINDSVSAAQAGQRAIRDRELYKRIGFDTIGEIWSGLRRSSPLTKGVAGAVAGLATWGIARSLRRKPDHTMDDLGPPLLPGGSAYEGLPPTDYSPGAYGYQVPPSEQGVTYQVNIRGGSYDPTLIQEALAGMVGGPVTGTIYNTPELMDPQRTPRMIQETYE